MYLQPPIAENGQLLVDGGYTNLVPGDIMLEQMNAKAVICVDVSKEDTHDYYEYGSSLGGFWLLMNSLNPFVKTVRVPSMGVSCCLLESFPVSTLHLYLTTTLNMNIALQELSQKLIWVSSTNHRSAVMDNVDLFLTPPVHHYGTLEYDKIDEIVQKGYDYAKPRVDAFIRKNPWIVS